MENKFLSSIIIFLFSNAICSMAAAYLMKKAHPDAKIGFFPLAFIFFLGYIFFFWVASKI